MCLIADPKPAFAPAEHRFVPQQPSPGITTTVQHTSVYAQRHHSNSNNANSGSSPMSATPSFAGSVSVPQSQSTGAAPNKTQFVSVLD